MHAEIAPCCRRIVDVMEELVRFTVLMRPHSGKLVDSYFERKEAGLRVDSAADHSATAIAPQS